MNLEVRPDRIVSDKAGRRVRVALLVPSSNTVMENDLHRALAPDRFTVHTDRMYLVETTREAEVAMIEEHARPAAKDVGTTNPGRAGVRLHVGRLAVRPGLRRQDLPRARRPRCRSPLHGGVSKVGHGIRVVERYSCRGSGRMLPRENAPVCLRQARAAPGLGRNVVEHDRGRDWKSSASVALKSPWASIMKRALSAGYASRR